MQDAPSTAAIDYLLRLLTWRGLGGANTQTSAGPDLTGFASLVADTQKAYLDTVRRHLDIVFAANDRIALLSRNFLTQRKAGDMLATQSDLIAVLGEAAADCAANWTEFNRTVQQFAAATATSAVLETGATEAEAEAPTSEPQKPPAQRKSTEMAA